MKKMLRFHKNSLRLKYLKMSTTSRLRRLINLKTQTWWMKISSMKMRLIIFHRLKRSLINFKKTWPNRLSRNSKIKLRVERWASKLKKTMNCRTWRLKSQEQVVQSRSILRVQSLPYPQVKSNKPMIAWTIKHLEMPSHNCSLRNQNHKWMRISRSTRRRRKLKN